jgi:hypothetical protein
VRERLPASHLPVIDKGIQKNDIYKGWYDYLQNLVEVTQGRHCRIITGMVEMPAACSGYGNAVYPATRVISCKSERDAGF